MLGFLITQQYGTTLLRADFEDTATPTEEENILNEEVSDEKSIDEDIILDKDTALVSESLLDLISDTIQSSVASEGDISNTETEEANISTPSHEAIE
jgi:hypothetical protein